MKDPTHDEMVTLLEEQGLVENREEDNFDIEEAIYWFAADHHGGQATNLYSVCSTSPFQPGAVAKGPEEGSLGEAMYQALEVAFG